MHQFLQEADRSIGLLVRTRPKNLLAERARLANAWKNNHCATPEFEYAPPPSLHGLLEGLHQIAGRLAQGTTIEQLYSDRALELAAEARLVLAVGTPDFPTLAAHRFPLPQAAEGAASAERAKRWASHAPGIPEPLHRSDARTDPESLISVAERLIGQARLPIRVQLEPQLVASAAAGDGVVFIRPGEMHRSRDARRIAVHEIFGHLVPRLNAKQDTCALFQVGSRGGLDDEEGRALWLEKFHRLMDMERRATLGRRHLLSMAVRRGADFVETVKLSQALGGNLESSLDAALRCHRGGGLARELVYLPALARFEAAQASGFDADSWLSRGPISIAAARQLADTQWSELVGTSHWRKAPPDLSTFAPTLAPPSQVTEEQ